MFIKYLLILLTFFTIQSAAQVTAITSPADGALVYVTTTNGTFTVIGFWGRKNSTWLKF